METTDKSQSESSTVLDGPGTEDGGNGEASGAEALSGDGTAPDEAGGGPEPEEERPAPARPKRRVPVDGFLAAPFPWYALDEAYTGPRRLHHIGQDADGTVQHGSLGHGDEPVVRADLGDADSPRERFAVVVTVGDSPVRRSADGTGVLEATSEASAAWLAGQGLLAVTWPAQMDHTLRDDWLEQQTETAWALADDLDGPAWSTLMLPVDGVSTPFHHRESEFGWVLAGSTPGGVHLGAYGRGLSAYGLGFAVVKDVAEYADPR
ncbi:MULTISPECIES: hypothetical protein [Streptomyces]|uniref:Uncharacterized protein n=1 Tax=Streptomyces gougerotii TaxID=53448 RepID=A0A8H9HI93_9ACTN|nr:MULTISPECIES: hypothetical protein [Streptomyces]MDQ0293374.1 hypothetical protein [Streptomyces sp. DSM 41037]PJM83345.1 hypothetical protein CH313_11105 [Streptomyces sp. TSRI0384-2]WPR53136.1 hypothetical protein SJI45_20860 [Streptomyces sp. S399]GFH77043.1 hypothetical protein Sgou_17130 [Streptomyces gougerotii]GGU66612.1 hypothetical protein GCM10010227_20430 [Streptomyces gougerotii]